MDQDTELQKLEIEIGKYDLDAASDIYNELVDMKDLTAAYYRILKVVVNRILKKDND